VLLIHGLGSLADSWWRIGPGLAALGFDVTAVDQAGHGGRALRGEATPDVLAEAVREIHPEPPDVLIGHSLGTVTALALQPGWGRTVILEEPASSLQPDVCVTISESLTADAVAVRRDRAAIVERVRRENPPWSDEDVHWSVEGMAQMDAAPFARRFAALARTPPPDGSERIVSAAPDAYVIAALPESGSVLSRRDRDRLSSRLPAGHLIELEDGHCLHRDAPDAWLAAVASIIG
jgi:pimeloyl-ACP methyl ester carboxylesterase